MRFTIKLMSLAIAGTFLASCAANNNKLAAAPIVWSGQDKHVVLIDPDVELDELTISGILEPRADWSKTGKDFIGADIRSSLSGRGITLVPTNEISDPREAQLVRLHGAVGSAILRHAYIANLKLANKKDALDWTLGPGVQVLRDHYGGDYALFVYVRDSYSSGSRKALMLGAAMLGVAIPGGQQTGFASLVDMRTGQIVWFNFLASATGDLRTDKPAAATVDALLKGLPL